MAASLQALQSANQTRSQGYHHPIEQPRIIICAYDVIPTGGTGKTAFELASQLLERGFEVTVVAGNCDLPRHPELRWIRVPNPTRPATLRYLLFFMLGAVALRRAGAGVRISEGPTVFSRVDAIRVHFCHRGYSERPTSQQRNRDSLPYRINAFLTSMLARAWESWCYRPSRVRKLLPVSSGVAQELRAHYPAVADRIEVIPNGVDTDGFRPDAGLRNRVRAELGLADEAMLALFVGGTWEHKGLRYALEAIAELDDWRLLVVGRGDVETYRQRAAQLGSNGRVRFVGEVDETAPYYAAADAFVFPTRYEAFSLVTLEAAAAGLPLLVTRVSGAEEVVREGENGWFIRRDPATIVPHLRALSEQPGLKERLAQAARASVAPFSSKRVADEYERLCRELIATPSH
jgi:glycosyltransferase involved in cell wall biosynthesis